MGAQAPIVIRLTETAQKRTRVLKKYFLRFGVLAGFVFLSYSLVGGNFGLLKIRKLLREKQALETQKLHATVELFDLARLAEQLRSDRRFWEYFARQKYHFARPEEKVYIFRAPEGDNWHGDQ